jgi:hypothetical protein
MRKRKLTRWDHRDLAAEIIRRAGDCSYVLQMDSPPTPGQKLQLTACRLLKRSVAIVPVRCASTEEWVKRYPPLVADIEAPNRAQVAAESEGVVSATSVGCDGEGPHWPPLRIVAPALR